MAFREKSAWITLVTTLIVYGGYFALVVPRIASGSYGGFQFVGLLSGAIVLIVILQVGLTIVDGHHGPTWRPGVHATSASS